MPDALVAGSPSVSTEESFSDIEVDDGESSSPEAICDRCDNREALCACAHCGLCHAACDTVCSCCGYCERHCGCSTCECCDETCRWTCSDCDRCIDCCACDSDDDTVSNVPRRESKGIFHASSRSQFTRNASKRFLACELEFSDADDGLAIFEAVGKWGGGIVDDGSLPGTGFEITTAPANGDKFVEQIKDICAALERDNATINADCGFHVHVDARDFKYWDLRRLIILYAKIERALFGMVPQSRRKNSFCLACGPQYLADLTETNRVKDKVIENVYGFSATRHFKTTRYDKYHSARYKALNIHSWFFRGTIECRLAAGTADARKIINWATLWASILDYANEHSETEINALGTGLDVLLRVAPESIRPWIIERTQKFSHVHREIN